MGSHRSGEALIAGETNGANALTMIVADNGKQEDFGVMFMVTPSGNLSVGPAGAAPVHAIQGCGYQGGVGVIGRGDPQEAIRGPNVLGRGTGGHGVKGLGGSGAADTNEMEKHHSDRLGKFKPGAGVLGIGGYWIGPNSDPKGQILRDDIGGPGVVGLAGGVNSEEVFDYETEFNAVKGIGVFGRSNNGAGVVGKGNMGPGVVGDGDIGVVGSSVAAPSIGSDPKKPPGTGVLGTGRFAGVMGVGAVGVVAYGTYGYAGHFRSDPHENKNVPQIHIEPQKMDARVGPTERQFAQPSMIIPAAISTLPRVANTGDLLVTRNPTGGTSLKGGPPIEAGILWFCALGSRDEEGAFWQEVLLGPPIRGGV